MSLVQESEFAAMAAKALYVLRTDQRYLACPARFERATYALEAVKMRLNNTKNNDIEVLASGVA